MRSKCFLAAGLGAALFLAGCATNIPPGAERGPHNTMAYTVLVDSVPSGARIEANGQDIGPAPVHIKIFGDPDGTFHDFGSYYYVVKAYPANTNEYVQVRLFRTGHLLTPEDRIPSQITFNMNQPPPQGPPPGYYPNYGPPPYPYYYGPPPYYGPYWGPYWGPSFQFYWGPGYSHRHW
jgi:hypothetical protein